MRWGVLVHQDPDNPTLIRAGAVSGAVTLPIVTSPFPAGECPGIPGFIPHFGEL